MHRLTATDTPMVRYTRTIFPSYAQWTRITYQYLKRWTFLTDYVDFCSVLNGLRMAKYSVSQNFLSMRPPGVRHKPYFFHNVLICYLGFTFTFWTSICIAISSTIQPHQVSLRTLKRIATPLSPAMISLSTARDSQHLEVTTCV